MPGGRDKRGGDPEAGDPRPPPQKRECVERAGEVYAGGGVGASRERGPRAGVPRGRPRAAGAAGATLPTLEEDPVAELREGSRAQREQETLVQWDFGLTDANHYDQVMAVLRDIYGDVTGCMTREHGQWVLTVYMRMRQQLVQHLARASALAAMARDARVAGAFVEEPERVLEGVAAVVPGGSGRMPQPGVLRTVKAPGERHPVVRFRREVRESEVVSADSMRALLAKWHVSVGFQMLAELAREPVPVRVYVLQVTRFSGDVEADEGAMARVIVTAQERAVQMEGWYRLMQTDEEGYCTAIPAAQLARARSLADHFERLGLNAALLCPLSNLSTPAVDTFLDLCNVTDVTGGREYNTAWGLTQRLWRKQEVGQPLWWTDQEARPYRYTGPRVCAEPGTSPGERGGSSGTGAGTEGHWYTEARREGGGDAGEDLGVERVAGDPRWLLDPRLDDARAGIERVVRELRRCEEWGAESEAWWQRLQDMESARPAMAARVFGNGALRREAAEGAAALSDVWRALSNELHVRLDNLQKVGGQVLDEALQSRCGGTGNGGHGASSTHSGRD